MMKKRGLGGFPLREEGEVVWHQNKATHLCEMTDLPVLSTFGVPRTRNLRQLVASQQEAITDENCICLFKIQIFTMRNSTLFKISQIPYHFESCKFAYLDHIHAIRLINSAMLKILQCIVNV